jgi:FAD/FMN-containing dehydrogenase
MHASPTDTLASTLSSYAEYALPLQQSAPALSAEAWGRALALASQLPASLASIFVLETRLQADHDQVDLSVCLNAGDSGHLWLVNNALPNHLAALPAWRNLQAFCQAWANPASLLASEIGHLWLEFDLATNFDAADSGQLAKALVPGVYFGPFIGDTGPKAWDWQHMAQTALPLLSGQPLPAGILANLAHAAALLPGKAQPFEVGMLLARAGDFARLCLSGLARTEIATYLAKLGWAGNLPEASTILNSLGNTHSIDLYLDVAEGGYLPHIGLECAMNSDSDDELGQWRAFLNDLVGKGWCDSAKAEKLLAWPGISAGWLSHTPDLQAFWRFLNHIKIIYKAGQTEAKAYLTLLHRPHAEPPAPLDSEAMPAEARAQIRSAFSRDFSRATEAMPQRVLQVHSEAQLSAALATAAEAGQTFTLRAEGNSANGRALSQNGLLIINGRPAAPEYARRVGPNGPLDLIEVSARTRWIDLEKKLNKAGLTTPVLPAYLDLSIGGTLAAGGYGLRAVKYGALCDLVASLRVLLPNGEAIWCSRQTNSDLFTGALGGGGAVIIERVLLPVMRYQRLTAAYFYEHPNTAAMFTMLHGLASLDSPPDWVRGWITRDGVIGSAYGLEHADQRAAMFTPPPEALRVNPARKIETYREYHYLVHGALLDDLDSQPDYWHLWADYLFAPEGAAAFLSFLETARQDAQSPLFTHLPIVRMLAIKAPPAGRISLPHTQHYFAGSAVAYQIALYYDVPPTADFALARAAVRLAHQTAEQYGGRRYGYGYAAN